MPAALWKMAVAEVDEVPVVIVSELIGGKWEPSHTVRIRVLGKLITKSPTITPVPGFCRWLSRSE